MTRSMRDFNDFIQEANLRDPPMCNASFTWSNLRENAVCRRLDRFLVSGGWDDCFPHLCVRALPRTTSDHCPIELDSSKFRWGPAPFRFENMWLLHPEFKKNIQKWWDEEQISGWPGYRFMRRLKCLSRKLKNWSREVFGDVEVQKREAEARLMVLDKCEGVDGLDNSRRIERENILLQVGVLAQKEETKWRQRSKIKWANEGDGNTKFFHRVASGNRKRSLIEKLEVEGLEKLRRLTALRGRSSIILRSCTAAMVVLGGGLRVLVGVLLAIRMLRGLKDLLTWRKSRKPFLIVGRISLRALMGSL